MGPAVLVANSNSNILVMEPAQDWYGHDAAGTADFTPNRRILLQRQVCRDLVVVFLIRKEQVTKMALAKHDGVIKTLPPDRADKPLCIPVLPWRPSRDRSIPDAHRAKAPAECVAIRAVAIANDIAWRFRPAPGLGQLTSHRTMKEIWTKEKAEYHG